MVGCSYTAINPGTMVVKSFDTLVTNTAMTRPVGTHNFAVGTKQNWVELFE